MGSRLYTPAVPRLTNQEIVRAVNLADEMTEQLAARCGRNPVFATVVVARMGARLCLDAKVNQRDISRAVENFVNGEQAVAASGELVTLS